MSALYSDPEMQEIFEGFLVETNELLESLSQDLMTIEENPDDLELINRIFRGFHTIKGTSSFMGFSNIAEITHHAEDILNKLRRSELRVSQPIVDVLLEVQDWIVLLVEKLQAGNESPVDYSLTIQKINQLKNTESSNESETQVSIEPQVTPQNTIQGDASGFVDAVLNNSDIVSKPGDFNDDELALIEAAFNEVNNNFWLEQKAAGFSMPKFETVAAPETKPTEQTSAEKLDATKASVASGPKMKSNSETIRIDVNRVETLMDLSGELVLGRNRLAQLTDMLEQEFENKEQIRDLIETTSQIDFVTSEIQAAVMRMRMVPVGKLYQKAPRIVRDLSKEFGKKINLIVKGEETEIDRGIIEELNDPLVHMIRNSCDHGIESPEKRAAVGKPEFGTITLDAEQEGNNIVLKISDDGAGMDPEKLKIKAIEKGVITQEQASQMSARDAYQLIFMPGFSTAVKVSAVSGRGVGMDVVRTNIQNLKGIIEIESEIGKGTSFIIKLPLTLAIIQGLLVKVQNETYALPLSSVVEVVAIDIDSVYTINKQEVVRIRQEVIPILRLDKALGVPNPKEGLENRYVVNVGLGLQRVGLLVDELLGQQEIVIKSLGEYLGNITGIAGSTILGDGRVIMIIDVTDLIQSIYQNEFMQFNR